MLSRSVLSTLGMEPLSTELGSDALGDAMLRRHEEIEEAGHQTWETAGAGEAAMLDLMAGGDSDEERDPLLTRDTMGEELSAPVNASAPLKKRAWCCRRGNVNEPLAEKPPHLLGQWTASAISGNDITSSILYMVLCCVFLCCFFSGVFFAHTTANPIQGGLCIASAGAFAPISILLVVALLYLFRSVYAEVVTALPLNGGAYNALLNTTTKTVAAIGGTLTVLSYVATAVVSADSAVQYFHSLVPEVPPFWLPVGILAVFALLNLIGISESSVVALIIFTFHCTCLTILMMTCIVYCFQHGWPMMAANWQRCVRFFLFAERDLLVVLFVCCCCC